MARSKRQDVRVAEDDFIVVKGRRRRPLRRQGRACWARVSSHIKRLHIPPFQFYRSLRTQRTRGAWAAFPDGKKGELTPSQREPWSDAR